MISKYFSEKEMRCKGKNCCGGSCPMDRLFMETLDTLRRCLGVPVYVNSGFRCNTYNAEVKDSAEFSRHREGIAADIHVNGLVDLEYIEMIADELGLYTIVYDTFIHVDGRYLGVKY